MADFLQPVLAAAVLGRGEADLAPCVSRVAPRLPAAADPAEAAGDAGRQEGAASQQHRHGQHQHQREGGRQEEAVLGRVEGSVPAEEQRVEGGHGQGAVPQAGLREAGGRRLRSDTLDPMIRSGAVRSPQGGEYSRARGNTLTQLGPPGRTSPSHVVATATGAANYRQQLKVNCARGRGGRAVATCLNAEWPPT